MTQVMVYDTEWQVYNRITERDVKFNGHGLISSSSMTLRPFSGHGLPDLLPPTA